MGNKTFGIFRPFQKAEIGNICTF